MAETFESIHGSWHGGRAGSEETSGRKEGAL